METYRPMLTAILDDSGSADILRLSGDLAWDTVNLMKDATGVLEGREGSPLVVDLSGLEFIDSKGISFLLQLRFAFENNWMVSHVSEMAQLLDLTFYD